MNIQKISAEQTLDLRSRILRPGQSIDLCKYAEDNLPTTFHLGIFLENKIVCNGTFIQQPHKDYLAAQLPYRLRGMATDTEFQKKGLGHFLLTTAETELRQRKCDFLWFNARIIAEKFYLKLGFETTSEVFDIPPISLHKVMYKWLKSR